MPAQLTAEQRAVDLARRDLTDPAEGPHAVQLLVAAAVGRLAAAWPCAVRSARGPRVVAVEDNYDALLITGDAASRDARYTRYVDDRRMLRSHSSALIPAALRSLAADDGPADDVLLVAPGIVYRRDSIDRLHTGTPHQLDLWRLARRPLGPADLDEMIRLLVAELAPGCPSRCERRVHPYTVGGRQVDVRDSRDGAWVEVWECGLAHPDVLAGHGLRGWSGLALGMGLDRLLMVRKGIPDIRLLRSTDERVAPQMLDLSPYRPVSALPAVVRDVSVAVDADDQQEDLGDRVRDALGTMADLVEEVTLLGQTAYADLPPQAVSRLGMSAAQKNVLVRIVLRPLDRTLTDEEANRLRDRIYAALHEGGTGEPPGRRPTRPGVGP
jgi:phenylalanyl-tRNA synthetase alpha chain